MSESHPQIHQPTQRRMGVEVQGRVDEYLLRLDTALMRRGATAAQRREAGVTVRNRILERLSARPTTGAHLTPADAEAVLSELGPPEKRAIEAVMPPSAPHRYTGPSSISATAVVALIWAMLFPLMIVLSGIHWEPLPGESRPWWQPALQYTLLPLGWSAPFATTVLGLLALGRIQKSGGRLYGLSLALFDSLLFPLLALDALVFWICITVDSQLADQAVMSAAVSRLVTQIVPTVACVLGDYFLAARAWMAVQRE